MTQTRTLLTVLGLTLGIVAGCSNVKFTNGGFDGSVFDHDGGVKADAHVDAGKKPPAKKDAAVGTADDDAGMMTADAGGASDAGSAMTGVAAWPSQLAGATCDALMQCYGDADLLTDTLGGRDCLSLNENLLRNGQLRYLADSVAAGLVHFQPTQLQSCLRDVRALGCDVRSSRLPASCRKLLGGTKLTADECTIDLDCQSDAFCDKGMLASCPGICALLQGEDLPCNNNNDAQCLDGLICFRGNCKPLGALGQTCGDMLPKCKPGLACVDQGKGLECASIATVYAKKKGEACDPVKSALCAPGLVCESITATTGACQAPVAKDASCKRGQPDPCPTAQYCDASAPGAAGTCRDRPGDGSTCLSQNRAPVCAPTTICVAGTCRQLKQVGDACTDAAECYSSSCGSDGTCAGPLMCAPP